MKGKISGAKKQNFVLAVVYSSEIHSGGASHYEISLQEILEDLSQEIGFELKTFHKQERGFKKHFGDNLFKNSYSYHLGLPEKIAMWAIRAAPGRELLRRLGVSNVKFERMIKRRGADLVYFASPNPLALSLTETPFITTVWDLGHRDLPHFPEMSANGGWEMREEYYRGTVPKSLFVVTDSTTTGEKLQSIYGLGPNKWIALGLLPKKTKAMALNELPLRELLDNYVYYPANKWAHKNHRVVFKALSLLKIEGVKVKLVLTGADKGFGNYLKELIRELEIDDLVVDLGFRSDEEVSWLMTNARAVVMPSLLGPTNLPPLEAGLLGVPAIVSDAHYFDGDKWEGLTVVEAHNPRAWANAIGMAAGITDKVPALDEVMMRAESRRRLKNLLESCRNIV